jgi:hypothetical protein
MLQRKHKNAPAPPSDEVFNQELDFIIKNFEVKTPSRRGMALNTIVAKESEGSTASNRRRLPSKSSRDGSLSQEKSSEVSNNSCSSLTDQSGMLKEQLAEERKQLAEVRKTNEEIKQQLAEERKRWAEERKQWAKPMNLDSLESDDSDDNDSILTGTNFNWLTNTGLCCQCNVGEIDSSPLSQHFMPTDTNLVAYSGYILNVPKIDSPINVDTAHLYRTSRELPRSSQGLDHPLTLPGAMLLCSILIQLALANPSQKGSDGLHHVFFVSSHRPYPPHPFATSHIFSLLHMFLLHLVRSWSLGGTTVHFQQVT